MQDIPTLAEPLVDIGNASKDTGNGRNVKQRPEVLHYPLQHGAGDVLVANLKAKLKRATVFGDAHTAGELNIM